MVVASTISVSSWTQADFLVEASSLVQRTHSHGKRTGKKSILVSSTGGRKNEDNNSKRNLQATATPENEKDSSASITKTKNEEKEFEGVYSDKPVLRGKFHKWGAIVYPPLLGIPLHLRALAMTKQSAAATTNTIAAIPSRNLIRASFLFSLAVESIMVISAILHRFPWKTNRAHQIARKLDFTAIFVGIALFYSSMGCLLMGHHPLYFRVIMPLVWACAVIGSLLKWCVADAPPWANAVVFLVQGWASLPCVPAMYQSATVLEASGMVAGGVFVTLGAIAYSLQWPKNVENKAQREIVFGPHEVFHVGTLFMVASFWYTMWVIISSSGMA